MAKKSKKNKDKKSKKNKDKKTSKSKDKKKKAKGKSKKTESAGKDEFGSRIGSLHSKVNALLMKKKKGLTMKEIMTAVDSETTFYNHLGKLVEAGYVKKADGKYKLRKKKRSS